MPQLLCPLSVIIYLYTHPISISIIMLKRDPETALPPSRQISAGGSAFRFMELVNKTCLVLALLVLVLLSARCSEREAEAARAPAGHISIEDHNRPGEGGGTAYGDDGYGMPDYDFYRKHGEVPSPGMGHWRSTCSLKYTIRFLHVDIHVHIYIVHHMNLCKKVLCYNVCLIIVMGLLLVMFFGLPSLFLYLFTK